MSQKHGVFQVGNKFKVFVNGVEIYSARMQLHAQNEFRRACKRAGYTVAPTTTLEPLEDGVVMPQLEQTSAPQFHINKRFDFLRRTVQMVASGLQASAIICGSGGLGKTHTVRKSLEEFGLSDVSMMKAEGSEEEIKNSRLRRSKSFLFVKGYSTPKGLFRMLFENNDSVIVFDDCDSVLRDPVALNLLKSALDSYDTRIITWNTDSRDDDLPRSFIFTGRVIFISNLSEHKIDQAVRSRAALIDVSMTRTEIIDRMETLIKSGEFLSNFDRDIKESALGFINDNRDQIRDINLRTLITVCKVRAAALETNEQGDTWKEMAQYLVCR